ncbi:MAG: hypothetical protein V1899_04475 [Planctomycetota bacterium]
MKHYSRRILVGVAILAIVVMVWFFFVRNETNASQSSNLLARTLVQILTPFSATAADWKNAKVSQSTLGDTNITYWALTNMRPIMEADTNTTAFCVRATNRRDTEGKIVTTVWSNKNANTLEIVWASGAVNRKDRSTDRGPMFDESHPDQHGPHNSGLGWTGTGTSEPRIVMYYYTDEKMFDKIVPFDYTQYFTVNGFISNQYPVAAMPLLSKDGMSSPSILLVDVIQAQLIGEIKLPAEAKSGRPNFILDQTNDVLLATQFNLDWLVAIDLRLYAQKSKEK